MPATEPQFAALNANYPPAAGAALADLLLRTPFWLRLPIDFNLADAAVLYTVPASLPGVAAAGVKMNVERACWHVDTSFTGGMASAIGISSDDADYNTKGDILGGAAGDVAATLVSTGRYLIGGTVGAKFGSNGAVTIASGKVIRFDRITSVFTTGVGAVHLLCSFVPIL
jgi:hypothetical protein